MPMLYVYVSDPVYLWLTKKAKKQLGDEGRPSRMAGRMLKERMEKEKG